MARARWPAALLPALLPLVLTSCGGKTTPEAPPGGVLLQGAGASFPNPLYQQWVRRFSRDHADVAVYYDSVGSGEGIKRFLKGAVDFGASDRAMSDDDIARVTRGVLLVPTAAGMVVLAYNPKDLPASLHLSRDVYADIFLGKVTKWNDLRIRALNPGVKFPDRAIALVTRLDKSGTTFAFTNHLSAVSPAWKSGPGVGTDVHWPATPLRANGNEGVCALLQETPYSLGYAEYGQAVRADLGLAVLQNKEGEFVRPDRDKGLKALLATAVPEDFRVFLPDPPGTDSYPIITYTWILAYKEYGDAKTADAVRRFLTYCVRDGQKRCAELGFVELPRELTDRVVAAVAQIK
jgi:phosphate transport system substrate-binding protein